MVVAVARPTARPTARTGRGRSVDAELGELLHRELGRSPFVSANASVSRGHERGFVREVGGRAHGHGTAVDAGHDVGAPAPVAVGGGDDLAGTEPPDPLEMVAVVAVDA